MIILNDVKNYLEKKLKDNDKIVIGVSGGPDSMCLLHILLSLKKHKNLSIICAHINHNVRKESEEEASFVKEYCIQNDCIFEYMKIDTYEQGNFEDIARKKRYDFYNRLIKKYNTEFLMTAHHGDDLMETILMRLTRGSNLSGYAGFKKETKQDGYELLRPLINKTKKDIDIYNEENKVEYRIDSSNNLDNYTRNRYRHHITPLLKKENKNIHKKFLKFSEELFLIDEFIEKETNLALTKIYNSGRVNLQEFNKLDYLLQKRVVEYMLKNEYENDISCINERHLNICINICKSNKSNVSINLPKKRVLVKSYNNLYFKQEEKNQKNENILDDRVILNKFEIIEKLTSCDIKKSNYVLRLDSSEIVLPLKIRYKKIGDRMTIKNFDGTKKVKDIFINEKISVEKRDVWPLIVDSNDTIIWIPGIKKSKFDKNIDEFYDIIYKYVISEEKKETNDK